MLAKILSMLFVTSVFAPHIAAQQVTLDLVQTGLIPNDTYTLEWSVSPSSTDPLVFDLNRGDLNVLIQDGSFANSIIECLVDDTEQTSWLLNGKPPLGEKYYYLVRAQNQDTLDCGTWNSGGERQQGDRDEDLLGSDSSCPCP